MEEKMKYSTRQQKIILECLQEYGDTFYTIDQFMELLRGKEIQIGRTTVYRGLERIPLQCGCIDHFVGHVLDEHGFEIDQSRTIFYGYCDSCRRLKK